MNIHDNRKGACNILLQRISGATHVSRDILQKVGDDMEHVSLAHRMRDEDNDEDEMDEDDD